MAHPTGGYKAADGTKVPSVTTIISRFKDSRALMHWAGKQGAAMERGEITSLYDKRDQAADAGTLAHAMVEAHIKGNDATLLLAVKTATDETAEQARQAFDAFIKWQSMSQLEIVYQEISMVSEKHRFAGTPDAIGRIDNELCLLDWKTSKGVYPDFLIQLAAYKELWEENHPDELITGGFHLCKFSKEHGDFSHHYFSELDDGWEQFLLFLRAYEIDKRLKKRV